MDNMQIMNSKYVSTQTHENANGHVHHSTRNNQKSKTTFGEMAGQGGRRVSLDHFGIGMEPITSQKTDTMVAALANVDDRSILIA